jgi:hypothetical protein
MATINYWGLSKKGSVTVNLTVTIDQLITAIATDEGLATEHYTVSSLADPSKSSLTFGDSSTTLTQLGLVDGGTVLCTTNQTGSKQQRQLQKLAIAAKTKTVDGYTRATLDTTQLPTLYSGNPTEYSNTPKEEYAALDSVTDSAGGGWMEPKHTKDIRGNSFRIYGDN